MKSYRLFFIPIFLLASLFAFSNGAMATDTCDGDIVNAYTCAIDENRTCEDQVGDKSRPVTCVAIDTCNGDFSNPYTCAADESLTCQDQILDQVRTVTCYLPDEFIANSRTACEGDTNSNTEFFAYSGGCPDTQCLSDYTCQPNDYFSCEYRREGINNCGLKSGNDAYNYNWRYAKVTCYPEDDYGGATYNDVYGELALIPCTSDDVCGAGFSCFSGYCGVFACPDFGLERTISYNLQDPAYAYGYAVAADTTHNTYAAGEQYSPATGLDAFVIKYDTSGNVVWKDVYNVIDGSGVSGNESAYGVAVPADGSAIYVVGRQQDSLSLTSDIFVRKYNSTGALQWTRTYDFGDTDIARGVAVDGSGNAYVAGYRRNSGGDVDALILSYDSAGNVNFGFPAVFGSSSLNESAYGITVSGSDMYVTGYLQIDASNADMFVRKYTTGGTLIWEDVYGISQSDIGYGVSVDSEGAVFVTGYQDSNGGDMFLRKYTADGVLEWEDSSTSTQNDAGRGVAAGHSKRVFVAGRQQTNNEDAFLVEYYALHTNKLKNFLYRGDQGGGTRRAEMGYGIAASDSSVPGYEGTANDVYVIGYEAESGGGMFLNKYSCNPLSVFGASTIANFHLTPQTGAAPLSVKADARSSAGNIVSYEWDWDYDGITFEASSDKNSVVTHAYGSAGSFTVALRITDTKGGTNIATASVAVTSNTAPAAEFQTCKSDNTGCVASTSGISFTGIMPLQVQVDGAASSDPNAIVCAADSTCFVSGETCPASGICPEGDVITSFSWDWGDGTVDGSGEKTAHTYSSGGTYTIRLTVTDKGGLTHIATQTVEVTPQYVCTSGPGPGGSCIAPSPVCGPGVTAAAAPQCYACLSDADCSTGYECLGVSCAQGEVCPNGALCPFDGVCSETTACNPAVPGATCPDGSACPANGICSATKYACVLSSDSVNTQCYIEEFGGCSINSDCRDSIAGGVCSPAGTCQYAKCLNTTDFACASDDDCTSGDGVCNAGVCNYVYDCAYGLDLGGKSSGLYATSTPSAMPKMPLGVQPDGQACTKPTSDAPNNCEGINGCLYYNYRSDGTPIANSNNSVGNCVNTFEGGTGCVYYQSFDGTTQREKVNCLPRYAENSKESPEAGMPPGCFVMDKGKAGKEYDCTAVDGCYYYLDGRVDCTYKEVTSTACSITTSQSAADAACAAAMTAKPDMIAKCNGATGLCENRGTGCLYEPNPEGAIMCPGATRSATGGDNFVQCLLNPDASLPGFLFSGGDALLACRANSDCPFGSVCINGTCYPQCQTNTDCVTGEQCTNACVTSLDCTGNSVCVGGVCIPPTSCTPGTICPNGMVCPANGICPITPSCTPGTICPNGMVCPANGICPITPSCTPGTICPNGMVCPASGICPITPSCTPGTICPNGMMCPANGICPTIPACGGGFPTGSIASGTTSTDIGLTTTKAASCSWSLVSTDPYPAMTPFGTTGATTHSTLVSGLFSGTNAYFVRCQETVGTITDVCQITFDVGSVCTSSAMCPAGYLCMSGVCQPPICSSAMPSGALAPGTTSATIGLTTDAASNCRYSTDSADPYASMTSFATTGGTSHSSSVSGLVTGSNTHYVRCQDTSTGTEKFCQIPFSVGVCNDQFKCDTGYMCIPNTGTGICTTIPSCTPGTLCPNGTICPANGMCPPPCVGSGCTALCSWGFTYNAATGTCDNCSTDPGLPGCGGWTDWCVSHPGDPICNPPGCTGPGCGAIPTGLTSCNTLGYTFTGTAVTPSGNCDLVAIILALLSWMAWIIALLAVLSGLRAGYLYITSMGDERKLILAKRYLIYTTIGIAVSVLTFSIVAITRAILNI